MGVGAGIGRVATVGNATCQISGTMGGARGRLAEFSKHVGGGKQILAARGR